MQELQGKLIEALASLAEHLPAADLDRVAKELESIQSVGDSSRIGSLSSAIPQSNYRKLVGSLVSAWKSEAAELAGKALALGLRTARQAGLDQQERAQLVGTGPVSPSLPLRRTDQVLLQMILKTRTELWIVSFAAYKVPILSEALQQAAQRAVKVNFVLETAKHSQGQLSFDVLGQLRKQFHDRAKFYVWPEEKRPADGKGRKGVLHAKCAVSDRKHLLVSSANLTAFAMELNMELGVQLAESKLARRVATHFETLVGRGVLQRL